MIAIIAPFFAGHYNINKIKMKLGVFSKTALVVTLMMSQITPNDNSHQYYEDDSDFDKIAAVFSGGWGWGLNSAKASCSEQSEFSCITVSGDNLPDYDPMGGYDPYPEMTEATQSTSGGGGGDGGANPAPPPVPQLSALEQCNLSQLENKNDCYTVADFMYNTALAGCVVLAAEITLLSGPLGGSVALVACGGVASVAHTDQKGNCDEQYQEELYYCQIENP